MKSTTKALVSGLVALACTSLASAAAVTYTAGDLVLAFRSSSVNSVFFYNLGAGTSYRDNGSQGQVADLGTTLSATYGATWFTDSSISWGVVGINSNLDPTPAFGSPPPVVNGDPSVTHYVSRATTIPEGSTPWGTFIESQLNPTSTKVKSANDIFAGFTATTVDGRGAVVTNTQASQYLGTNGVGPNSDFGLFSGGIEGSFNTGEEFAYLDLYRILATTTGATPTGTLGLGSYETTFSINALGQVFATDASAVPEPSTYGALAGAAVLGLALSRRRSRKA